MMTGQTMILIAVTLTAAVTDATRGKVYNWLTYPAAVAGLILSVVAAPPTPIESVVGLALGLLLFGALRRIGKMGAGDVKLMAAVGALKGPVFLVFASFYVIVAAGLAAIVVLAMKRRLVPTLRWAATLMVSAFVPGVGSRQLGVEQTEMPFAPAIFLGVAYAAALEMAYGQFSF